MVAETQSKLIDYFRRCYRADNYGISISDVSRLSASRFIEISQSDDIASGTLPRIPITNPNVSALEKQVDKYRKERLLVYACFFVTGQLESSSGFAKSRKINSPLIYFPARLFQDEDHYLDIDTKDLRVNRPLLRQLLKPELDASALETFPNLSWPLTSDVISKLTAWIRANTTIEESEELGRWPKLSEKNLDHSDSSVTRVRCACAVLLAERSKGSRGVLHELKILSEQASLSPALEQMLGGDKASVVHKPSEPELIPGLLSKPQLNALDNAAREPVSMISGPPGTGKSYTIGAMAIDRMLHGESVLIVSRSDQAINVVGEKLLEDFGLTQGYVHTPDDNFLRSIKDYLESLLSQGIDTKADVREIRKELSKKRNLLTQLSSKFEKKLRATRWVSEKLVKANGHDNSQSFLAKILLLIEKWINPVSLWSYPDQLNKLQNDADRLSSQYLNAYRTDTLKDLLQVRRSEISKFLQALKARSSKVQEERFSQTDFDAVLDAFPIWLVNVNDLNRVLPLSNGMFDLVIFDEATQCDIATALPALFRAKRAVVVGDKKQLRHVSFVSRSEQQSLYEFCQLDSATYPQYSYRDQSVLDLASDVIKSQSAVCMLDEYYRGKVDLISFSNKHFYSDRLKVMRSRPGEIVESALSFIKLEGERNNSGRNKVEASCVVEKIQTHLNEYKDALLKPSVGVLSPFREQAMFLEKEIQKAFNDEDIQDFKIRVDTPYGFQGEERDLILLSMSIDPNSGRAAAYLNRDDMFNVAVTRAKERMYVYHSVDVQQINSGNLFRQYLEHDHLEKASVGSEPFRCEFAKELHEVLSLEGYHSWVGFEIAGLEIDVVCQKNNVLMGIDLVGFPGDFHDYYDVETYKTLHRAGIDVMPIAHSSWKHSRRACLDAIHSYVNRES